MGNYQEVLEGCQNRIVSELSASQEPDIISPETLGEIDPSKGMDTGLLLDLNPILEIDDSFNRDDYIAPILDARLYTGKQYVMPLNFYTYATLSSKDIIDQIWLDPNQNSDFQSFMAETVRCMPAAKDKLGTQWMFNSGEWWRGLFSASWVKLLDYENKKVLHDDEAFKIFCESYKPYYSMDMFDGVTSDTDDLIYLMPRWDDYLNIASILKGLGGVSMNVVRGTDDRQWGEIGSCAGIRAGRETLSTDNRSTSRPC